MNTYDVDFCIAEFYGIEDIFNTFNVIVGKANLNMDDLNKALSDRFCFHRDNGNYDFAAAYKDLLVKIGDEVVIAIYGN